MINPKRNPRDPSDDVYTCPDETRGHYYSGPTRVSLVDLQKGKVINTIKVREEDSEDTFDVPYKIHAGSYYNVPGVAKGKEGTTKIIWLKDYNGDGKPLEFALYDAEACMGLATTLIGYSERQDKVIQYPIILNVKGEGKPSRTTSHWCDYLFSVKPCALGQWHYEVDYRGRGGSLDTYKIRYNPQREQFEGTYKWSTRSATHPSYYSVPRRCR